jgi:hypothetical protein
MARTLMNLVSIPVLMRTRHNEVRFMKQFDEGLSKEQLASIFHSKFFDIIPGVQGQQDRLTKSEFILLLLHMMNKIDLKQVMIAGHLFDKMHKERTGQLTMDKLTKEMDLAMSEQEIEDMRRMSKEIDISQRVDQFARKISISGLLSESASQQSSRQSSRRPSVSQASNAVPAIAPTSSTRGGDYATVNTSDYVDDMVVDGNSLQGDDEADLRYLRSVYDNQLHPHHHTESNVEEGKVDDGNVDSSNS